MTDRPPEVGDRLSNIEEPPPWLREALEQFWRALAARPRSAGPVLPWSIGPGPTPHNNSRLTRTLYAPDNPKQPTQADGKDVKALKRAVSRAGFWAWQEFDTNYSNAFAHGATGPTGSGPGVDGLRKALGLDASGTLSERVYHSLLYAKVPQGATHAGEWVVDATTENLLEEYQQAWDADHQPPKPKPDEGKQPQSADQQKTAIRNAMADYCRRSINSEPGIHYQQVRPIACFGVKPEAGFTTDCSGHATCVYYWARKVTGIAVPDPNPGNGYNGYGYTGTLINNPECHPNYLVGDLAIYGPSKGASSHVATCYQGGDGNSSKWCSHGSEAAPYSVALRYRDDLLCVVRPPLLP